MMYYVYILKFEKSEELYIGYTHNLKERIEQHRKGLSKFTKNKGNFRLIYYEAYLSREDAIEREKQLKYQGQAIGQLKRRIRKSLSSYSQYKVGAG